MVKTQGESFEIAAFGICFAILSLECEPAQTAREAPAGCDVACAHVQEIGRQDPSPEACDLTPKMGPVRSCADLCRTVEAHGQSFSTLCLSRIRRCTDIASCGAP